jgi:hypothetical protein
MVALAGAVVVALPAAALGCADVSGAEDPESPHPNEIIAANIAKVALLTTLFFTIMSIVLR